MNITKHTPGPWTYERKLSSQGDYHDKRAAIFAHGDVIGQAYQSGDNDLNAQANARLIAAAPDLAEALKAVAEFWAGGDAPSELTAQIERALAKAGL